jgi:hypothetical protein
MKNERDRESGKCSKMVPDRGDRCLFTFLSSRRVFLKVVGNEKGGGLGG